MSLCPPNFVHTPKSFKLAVVSIPLLVASSLLSAVTIVLTPNDLGLPNVGSTFTQVPTGVPFTSTAVPDLTVTFSNTLVYRSTQNAFAATNATGGLVSYSFAPGSNAVVTSVSAAHGGVISGSGFRFDQAVFGGALAGGGAIPQHNLTTVGNFTDVTAGDVGRVNKASTSPNNSRTLFEWLSGAPANSGTINYSSDGTGNAGVITTIEFDRIDIIPEPSRAILLALGIGSILFRRRR